MKLAVVIDPIERLNPKKDSTIAMLRAAAKKGLSVYAMTQADMFVRKGKSYAALTPLTIQDDETNWYQAHPKEKTPLAKLDIIIMRKDPPFDMNYIYTTYLLELAEQEGVLVANKPQSLRDASEKYFTQFFPSLCPDTLISQSYEELKAFYHEHGNVIFKPLDGMGGRGILNIYEKSKNLNVGLELLTENGTVPIMAQAYIPEINTGGDKRILIIGKEIIPYALARMPEGDDPRGNLARGAVGKVIDASPDDLKLASQLIETLAAKALHFVGIDVIGPYITEINVTSPTGIREIEKQANIDVSGKLIDYLCQLRP